MTSPARITSTLGRLRARWAAIGAAVAVTLGTGGVSIVGAITETDNLAFTPITPCRALDTRADENIGPRRTPLTAGETLVLHLQTHNADPQSVDCGIDGSSSVVANITVLDATSNTHITTWPAYQPRPNASTINTAPGQPPTANSFTSALTNGDLSVYNSGGEVHVIIDIVGYYAPGTSAYSKSESDDRFVGRSMLSTVTDNDTTPAVLSLTPTVVAEVSVPVASAGYVTASTGGYVHNPSASTVGVQCSLSTNTSPNNEALTVADIDAGKRASMNTTHAFKISQQPDSPVVVRLICSTENGSVSYEVPQLTATYMFDERAGSATELPNT